MKAPTYFLVLAFALTAPAFAASKNYEMPTHKAGTGSHDFYNVGIVVGDDVPDVWVAIATSKKVDISDVRASTDTGESLRVGAVQTMKALLGKADCVIFHLTEEQTQKAKRDGLTAVLQSKRGKYQFFVPADQFVAVVRDSSKDDRYSLRKRIEVLGQSFPDPDDAKTKGTAKITGQAFLKTRGGDVRIGAGNAIMLYPADDWTTELMELIGQGAPTDRLPPKVRHYIASAVRTTTADAQGNFEFDQLPAGKYRINTLLFWEIPTRYGMETTGGKIEIVALASEGSTTKAMLTR